MITKRRIEAGEEPIEQLYDRLQSCLKDVCRDWLSSLERSVRDIRETCEKVFDTLDRAQDKRNTQQHRS